MYNDTTTGILQKQARNLKEKEKFPNSYTMKWIILISNPSKMITQLNNFEVTFSQIMILILFYHLSFLFNETQSISSFFSFLSHIDCLVKPTFFIKISFAPMFKIFLTSSSLASKLSIMRSRTDLQHQHVGDIYLSRLSCSTSIVTKKFL